MIFSNGADRPLNANSGTLPNVSGALLNWFQPLTFGKVIKVVNGFIVSETDVPVNFQGIWQPLSGRQLMMKPEGQREWNWFWLHAEPTLILTTDNIVTYLGKQYRVETQKDYSLYGYVEYHLVEDYEGSGPTAVEP